MAVSLRCVECDGILNRVEYREPILFYAWLAKLPRMHTYFITAGIAGFLAASASVSNGGCKFLLIGPLGVYHQAREQHAYLNAPALRSNMQGSCKVILHAAWRPDF